MLMREHEGERAALPPKDFKTSYLPPKQRNGTEGPEARITRLKLDRGTGRVVPDVGVITPEPDSGIATPDLEMTPEDSMISLGTRRRRSRQARAISKSKRVTVSKITGTQFKRDQREFRVTWKECEALGPMWEPAEYVLARDPDALKNYIKPLRTWKHILRTCPILASLFENE